MSQAEAHVLHQRDQQLHTTGPVEFAAYQARQLGEHVPNEPTAKIDAYMGRLATHSLMSVVPEDEPVAASKMLEKQRRQIDARVIKAHHIPESFFETQRKAAREQGHGDIEITDQFRELAANVLQTDQRESLRDWVDYLTDKDSNYPTWFKYYTYRAISKLSDYDKDKGEFPKRSRSTTDPFPSLNREALAYVYDNLAAEVVDLTRLKDPTSNTKADKLELKEVDARLKKADFSKLYAKALSEIGFADPELLKETRGSWVKYAQSDNPKDVQRLSNSLKGYGTGWCTAGEGYARTQLSKGDFYTYYTFDKKGVARVPRIAIRMDDGQVAEVRGIVGGTPNAGPAENTSQEMEPQMIDIAMDKVKDLPGGEDYFAKAQDMKRVTALEHKAKTGEELSYEDLLLLYEIKGKVRGFGYGSDPRLADIIDSRNAAEDILNIFSTDPELPHAQEWTSLAHVLNRLYTIEQKLSSGEDMTVKDLEFVYGFDGPVYGLKYVTRIDVFDLVAGRDKASDFLQLAESMAQSTDSTKVVQAEALKLYASVAAANKDNSQLSAQALGILYEPSARIQDLFKNGPLVTVLYNLANRRHYGNDYGRLQRMHREQLTTINDKTKGSTELTTDELKLMYNVNFSISHTNEQQWANILAQRDLVADIKQLLELQPQYEIFADELTEKARNTARLLDALKREKDDQEAEDDWSVIGSQRLGRTKNFFGEMRVKLT